VAFADESSNASTALSKFARTVVNNSGFSFPLTLSLRFLKLRDDDAGKNEREEREAQLKSIRAGLERLEAVAGESSVSQVAVETLLEKHNHRRHLEKEGSIENNARQDTQNFADDRRRTQGDSLPARRK
jgi:hypothetical protein